MPGRESEGLKGLGRKTEYKSDYAPEVLESFVNKHHESLSDHRAAGFRRDLHRVYP